MCSKEAGNNPVLYPVKGQPSPINMLADPSLAECLRFPYGALKKKCAVSKAFRYLFLGALSIGALSPGSLMEPLEGEICFISKAFLDMFCVPFRVPSKGALPPGSPHRAPIYRVLFTVS